MAQSEAERVRLRVTGRVQGVFYRASTQECAVALGLVGWVRNTRDGAVEIEAEGSRARVQQLIDWCRQGPPAARVRDVTVEGIEPLGGSPGAQTSFDIRH